MALARAAREAGLSLTVADVFRSPALSDMAEIVAVSTENKEQERKLNEAAMVTKREAALANTKEKQPARFSLLRAANTDAFIQDYLCPKVGVFRIGIVDAFPVTDFQALAIAGSLLEQRWMLNYFFFDGTGFLDINRIRKAASALVQHFDILRTVFISCGNSFLQVVLKRIRPPVLVYETETDLDEYTRQLRQESPGAYPRLGEPYIQFMVIKKLNSSAHRIVIRLSHAQYDGVCLPKIIEVFKMAYEGKETMPEPSPPFSNYVKEATNGNASQGNYEYWNGLLKGSSMTHLVPREQPKYSGTGRSETVLKKTIDLPALASKNVTTATMLKAAWALVLAQMSGRSDIVFGNLISGRNAAVDDVESIVGACLNIVPVRVQIEPKWTALDLLRRIQNQQVAGMSFESLGFREIIQHCTDWPEWTYFSSIVQHQNLAEDVSLDLDKVKYKVGFLAPQDTLADVSIVSTPKGEDTVEVALGFIDDGNIPPTVAQAALDLTCSLAQQLAEKPKSSLTSMLAASPLENITMPRRAQSEIQPTTRTGQQHQQSQPPPDPRMQSQALSTLRTLEKSDLYYLADTLTRCWRMVLPLISNNSPGRDQSKPLTALTFESNFYAAGGDLVSLASLTSILEGEGYIVRLEDLIARPTVGQQVALLAADRAAQLSSSETLAGVGQASRLESGNEEEGKG
ncbi:MAG: hypothetical protein Q9191_000892, partial [Dirinaria sp. TL-2023a]